jgi:hypothetical protein
MSFRKVLVRIILDVFTGIAPGWLKLVHTVRTDSDQGGAEVVGSGVGGGEGLVACLDFHGAVAAGGADEFLDAPTAFFTPGRHGTRSSA